MFSIHAGIPGNMPSPTAVGVGGEQDTILDRADRLAPNERQPFSGNIDAEAWSPDEFLSRIGAGTTEPRRTIIAGELPKDMVQ